MEEFEKNWTVALLSFLGVAFSIQSIPFYSFGIIAPHIAKEWGWSMSDVIFGITIVMFSLVPLPPLIGLLADRIGTRAVVLVSAVVFGVSLFGLAVIPPSRPLYYGLWVVMAIGGAGTSPMVWARYVSRFFTVHTGLAIGIAVTGAGVFGTVVKPILTTFVLHHGWRPGMMMLGALSLVIVPLGLLTFRDDSADAGAAAAGSPHGPDGVTLQEASRTRRFATLAFVGFVANMCLAGLLPQIENLLSSYRFAETAVATITPVLGLSVIAGRLFGGAVQDRFWAPGVGFCFFAISAIGMVIFAFGIGSVASGRIALGLVGLSGGMEYVLLPYCVARYFGVAHHGAIYGAIYAIMSLGGALGTVLYSRCADLTGSYQIALIGAASLLSAIALLLLTLGRYRTSVEAKQA
ncbi:MFS transporter [Sphingomonas sp. CGMCC 1.13654]|uniref:MFS transporter n=1 Tax=Sphingomonas chungangi TaxID=2683589 RepID=A0A838LGK4_9SPHN|nr:MFS transporter [Sphingomonas chungangi]MBA2936558.1 MFS transporter [Sphingomonas chungangi]MVW55943.1 MFS transporter [Sphingomonas chungangi]